MWHMTEKICEALVISCIDFRLQRRVQDWGDQQIGVANYDQTEIAGAIFDSFEALKQLEVSVKLHQIKKVIAINHEDCGAYGAAGTPERHKADLLEFKNKVNHLYPKLAVELYYLHLDGTFEPVTSP
jgi:carbonic anhydrase